MGGVCTDRAELGEVPVNTGTESKGQLGLCRVQAGAARDIRVGAGYIYIYNVYIIIYIRLKARKI